MRDKEQAVLDGHKHEAVLYAQLRQQEVIVELGLHALSGTDLQAVLNEAVNKLKEVLGVEYTKVLERLPNGQRVIVRAGVGWDDQVIINETTVDAGMNSQAGYTLVSEKPVIVADLRTETRFSGPALLTNHGVISGMSCVIWGRDKQPYGVLGIHTRKKRTFTTNDVAFLQAIANTLAAAIQRKQDEERLRESEEHFRATFHEAAIAMSITDLSGEWKAFNHVYRRLLGYTLDELEQLDLRRITHPDDREKSLEGENRLMAGEVSSINQERRYIHKNGKVIWGLVHLSAVRDADDQPKCIITAIQDITERKEAEAKLQYQKSLLEAQQEASPLGILVVSQDGKILIRNQLFLDMWKFPSDVIEKELDEVALQVAKEELLHPEEFLNDVREVYQSRKKSREKLVFKDGRIYQRYGSPVKSETGEQYGYVWYFQDITAQENLVKQKDDFISIASHELKTPVTSIKAYTQVLYNIFREQEDKTTAEMLAKMDTQIDKLTKLIVDLLDVTKIEHGNLQFRKEHFPFNRLVQDLVEDIQRTAHQHRLTLELAPDISVYGDQDRIGQVITNLLNNAVKYSPDADKVIVRTAIRQGELVFSVQDFGRGLSKKDQVKVFERFYRAGDPRYETYPGLGLGLYISAGIIQRHRGKIGVESKKGNGSTFYFSLPVD